MFVYLLTKNSSKISAIRQTIESPAQIVISCCSANVLLGNCLRGNGCVLFTVTDYSPEEILSLAEKLRTSGFPHALLALDRHPTFESAHTWLKLPIFDYVSLQTDAETLKQIIRDAQIWAETEGQKEVVRTTLRQKWAVLDQGLKEVLHLLYDGLTNREIAEKLSLSPRTIESRRAKLLDTFGVGTFAELIRLAAVFMEEGPIPQSFLYTNSPE